MNSRIVQDHPFFPLRVGTVWEYETEQSSAALLKLEQSLPATRSKEQVVKIERESGRLLATLIIHYDYLPTEMGTPSYVSLLPEGLMFGNGPESESPSMLRVRKSEGVYLPRELPLDQRWSLRVELGNEQQTQALASEFHVTGFETMEVPAGRYTVVHIESTSRNLMQIKPQEGLPTPPPVEHTQSQGLYYARGVGLVRSITETSNGYRAVKTLIRFTGK